jgi:hypothetical protein
LGAENFVLRDLKLDAKSQNKTLFGSGKWSAKQQKMLYSNTENLALRGRKFGV